VTRSSPRPARLSLLDLLALGMIGIHTRKLRAALSALGISIGIATMVIVTGVPASSHAALDVQLSRLGPGVLQATAMPNQHPAILLPTEAEAMVARIGPVREVTAVANTHASVSRNTSTDAAVGIPVLASRLNLLHLVGGAVSSGRFLDAVTERFPTVVLGAEAASRLGITTMTDAPAAPQVFVSGRRFTVIGILRPVSLAPEIDRAVLIGWDAARDVLRFDGHPTVLYVQAHDSAVEAVRSVLPATIYPEAPGLVRVSRPSDALFAKRVTDTTLSALFLGLAAVALLVGGVGVANTMVISVLERRKEIGLRRALGATRGHIRMQFLAESIALSILGGLAGATFGTVITVGYAAYHRWPPVVPPAALAAAVGGAVLVGIVAGGYPAIRAARLTPTEALAA
jgi:putative ABC transport system permease protein